MVWWDRDVEPGSVRNCHLPMAPTATMAEQEGARQKWVIAWHGDSHVICSQQNSYLLNFLYSLIPLALCSCERDCEKKKKIPVWDFTYPRKSCCHGLGMALPSLVLPLRLQTTLQLVRSSPFPLSLVVGWRTESEAQKVKMTG